MLDRMVAEGRVSVAQIRAIAGRLAAFHRAAAADQGMEVWSGGVDMAAGAGKRRRPRARLRGRDRAGRAG